MRLMTSPDFASPQAVVAASAKGLTRRRLIGNAGSVGLGAALTCAFAGRRPDAAYASHMSDQNAGYCGPGPICGCTRCDWNSDAQCDAVEGGIGYAYYRHGDTWCISSCGGGACRDNCWPEGPSSYWCCDCCVHNAGQRFDSCSSCGWDPGHWWKCICEQAAC